MELYGDETIPIVHFQSDHTTIFIDYDRLLPQWQIIFPSPTQPAQAPRTDGNHSGTPLRPFEITVIENLLTGQGISIPRRGRRVTSSQFLIHDTAVQSGTPTATGMSRQHSGDRGPLGSGVAAWLPRSGNLTLSRPDFFRNNRPTATEFEKSGDILAQSNRESLMRDVWNASNNTSRTAAQTAALAGLGMSASEISSQTTLATDQLNRSSGDLWTTAIWTVRELCRLVNDNGVSTVARSPSQESTLTTSCNGLSAYYTARNTRISSTVNVELAQTGLGQCSPTGARLPAYTNLQYRSTALIYLRAAYAANEFPVATSHFWTDRNTGSHCDPRCFNFTRFYNEVARNVGHPIGSLYGITPNYGTTRGTHNVWWSNSVCGGSPP